MPILWASCSTGFLRCPVWRHLLFLIYRCDLIELTSIVAVVALLMIGLCIGYKHVLLLQSTQKKLAIFLSVGILEHPPYILFLRNIRPIYIPAAHLNSFGLSITSPKKLYSISWTHHPRLSWQRGWLDDIDSIIAVSTLPIIAHPSTPQKIYAPLKSHRKDCPTKHWQV